MVVWLSKTIEYILFRYDTANVTHVRSKPIGIINRVMQITIIGYIIGYVLIYKRGYQDFTPITSVVTTKVKGVAYTNITKFIRPVSDPSIYNRLWDAADYVIPPQENGAFFVMTNAVINPNQEQGKCPEAPMVGSICTNETEKEVCIEGSSLANGNGVMTGRCLQNDYNASVSTCEVRAWCPVENRALVTKTPLLLGAYNFTVLVKNSVEFPPYKNAKKRNILDTSNPKYLTKCRFHAIDHPFCPIFKLGHIVEAANVNFTELATTGGIIGIVIYWNCNLDFSITKCVPRYSFQRLDNPDGKVSKGWNFRYANYFENGKRTLTKAYGILFLTFVEGQGGKFKIIPLFINIGTGLALLSLSVVICDIIVLYVMKKNRDYDKIDDADTVKIQLSGAVQTKERNKTDSLA